MRKTKNCMYIRPCNRRRKDSKTADAQRYECSQAEFLPWNHEEHQVRIDRFKKGGEIHRTSCRHDAGHTRSGNPD